MNDAVPASGYAEAYAAWRANPEAWWAAIAEGITWDSAGTRVRPLIRPLRPLVPRRHAEHLLQLPRPPCRSPAAASSRR